MGRSTEQQITALFVQALRTALAILDENKPARPTSRTVRELPTGIYPHRSKYNPYRAYCAHGGKTHYLGAFPTVAKAKAARKAFLAGQAVTTGTRVANGRKPLRLVKAA